MCKKSGSQLTACMKGVADIRLTPSHVQTMEMLAVHRHIKLLGGMKRSDDGGSTPAAQFQVQHVSSIYNIADQLSSLTQREGRCWRCTAATPMLPESLLTPAIKDAVNVCRGQRCWRCTAMASCWAAMRRSACGGNAQRASMPPRLTLRMAWLLGATAAWGSCSRQDLQVGSQAHIQSIDIEYIHLYRVPGLVLAIAWKAVQLFHLPQHLY